jgi:hypothetical protein
MAIYLVSPNPTPVIDEVFDYYQYTALPDVKPKYPRMDIPAPTARSTLCHVSISHWIEVSGFTSFSPERTESGAHLAACVTRKTVAALNEQAAGTFQAAFPIPEEVKARRRCHDMGGEMENTRGKMNCLMCHSGHNEMKPNSYKIPPQKELARHLRGRPRVGWGCPRRVPPSGPHGLPPTLRFCSLS